MQYMFIEVHVNNLILIIHKTVLFHRMNKTFLFFILVDMKDDRRSLKFIDK